jgi:hypothetical protein
MTRRLIIVADPKEHSSVSRTAPRAEAPSMLSEPRPKGLLSDGQCCHSWQPW